MSDFETEITRGQGSLTPDFHDLTTQNQLREVSMTGHIFTNHESTYCGLFAHSATQKLNKTK